MTRQHRYLDGPWHDVQEKCPATHGDYACLDENGSPWDADQYRDKPEEARVDDIFDVRDRLASLTERVEKLELMNDRFKDPVLSQAIDSLRLRVTALEDQPPAPPQELDSPNFIPKQAKEFEARGFERVNRHQPPAPPQGVQKAYEAWRRSEAYHADDPAVAFNAGYEAAQLVAPPQEKITLHRGGGALFSGWIECHGRSSVCPTAEHRTAILEPVMPPTQTITDAADCSTHEIHNEACPGVPKGKTIVVPLSSIYPSGTKNPGEETFERFARALDPTYTPSGTTKNQHDEDCPCSGDRVEHTPDCLNCECAPGATRGGDASCPSVESVEEPLTAHVTSVEAPSSSGGPTPPPGLRRSNDVAGSTNSEPVRKPTPPPAPEREPRRWTLHLEKDGNDSVCHGIFSPGGTCGVRDVDGVPHVRVVELTPAVEAALAENASLRAKIREAYRTAPDHLDQTPGKVILRDFERALRGEEK